MRSPKRSLLLALAVPLLVAGCVPVVYSDEPLGERVAVLKPEEWNGVWLNQSGGLSTIVVSDPGKGTMKFGKASNNDWATLCDPSPSGDEFAFRQSGSWYFPYEQTEKSPFETVFALLRKNDALISYGVDESNVRDLIEKGVLPGRVENRKVILGALTPDHYKILLSKERPALFRFDPWGAYVKLPAALDPCKKPAETK